MIDNLSPQVFILPVDAVSKNRAEVKFKYHGIDKDHIKNGHHYTVWNVEKGTCYAVHIWNDGGILIGDCGCRATRRCHHLIKAAVAHRIGIQVEFIK